MSHDDDSDSELEDEEDKDERINRMLFIHLKRQADE